MNFIRTKASELCFLILIVVWLPGASQKTPDNETMELIRHGNYGSAFPAINKELEKQPDHPLLNYYAGLCYLHSRSQKPKAVGYLEKAAEHSQWWRKNATPSPAEAPADVHKLLGDAYYYAFKFDAALGAYEKYRDLNAANKNDSLSREVAIKIDLSRHLNGYKPASTIPLSAHTGSPCADLVYGTMTSSLSPDRKEMTYVLRVPAEKLRKSSADDNFFEDSQLPPLKDSASIRRKAHENKKHIERDSIVYAATIGTSYDGQVMLTYKNDDGNGNLYISRLRDNKWTEPVKMKKSANKAGWELYESLSPDGKTLYFASDRPGGYGGADLYKCTLKPDGTWSKAINLGAGINTEADEIAPLIHADGNTLFFSSNRNRPGSYDIFSAVSTVANNWSAPQNVGFPINRNEKDIFQVDVDRKRIFGSQPAGMQRPVTDSARSEKKETLPHSNNENYLITFTGQTGEALHLRRGVVKDRKTEESLESEIFLIDNATGETIARYHTNSQTGEFAMILPSGKDLQAVFHHTKHLPVSEHIDVRKDKNHFDEEPVVTLPPMESGASCTLSNVFFEADKTVPEERSKHELERIASLLKDNRGMKAEVSDVIFTTEKRKFYKRLAKDRARAVVAYLEKEGVDKKQLSADWSAENPPKKKLKKDKSETRKSRIKKRTPEKKEKVEPVQTLIFTIRELKENN